MMRVLSAPLHKALLLLLYASLIHAQRCTITGENFPTLTNLVDLRTPTPYTMTITGIAINCSLNPTTFTLEETMVVDGTFFRDTGPTTVTIQNQTTFNVYYTFPSLTVTSLTPGEPLTLVDQGGGAHTYFVPTNAVTNTPSSASASASASVSASTSPSSTSSPSSTPVGGIVAGVVVGVIVIAAIAAFATYKIIMIRRSAPRPGTYQMAPSSDFSSRHQNTGPDGRKSMDSPTVVEGPVGAPLHSELQYFTSQRLET